MSKARLTSILPRAMAKLSYGVIIFLVILGCVVAVVIGYSVHYVSTNGFYRGQDKRELSDDQRNYTKLVRVQNREWLMGGASRSIPSHG